MPSPFLTFVLNFLFITAAMIIFVAPFYYLYRRRHYDGKEVKVDINRHMELFFSSTEANYLVFFWAMGEALFWFVIPEFLLLLVIFMRVKNKFKLLLFDIYGTICGILLALILDIGPNAVANMPYMTENMVLQTQVWYDKYGILALIYQPFSGVPFKSFTHLAGDYGFFIPAYIGFAVLARVSRYALAYLVLTGMYKTLHGFVYRNYVKLFFIASIIFTLLLLEVSGSYGPDYELVY